MELRRSGWRLQDLTGCPGKHVAARTGVAEGGWGQGPRSPKFPGIWKAHEEKEPPQVNTAQLSNSSSDTSYFSLLKLKAKNRKKNLKIIDN